MVFLLSAADGDLEAFEAEVLRGGDDDRASVVLLEILEGTAGFFEQGLGHGGGGPHRQLRAAGGIPRLPDQRPENASPSQCLANTPMNLSSRASDAARADLNKP